MTVMGNVGRSIIAPLLVAILLTACAPATAERTGGKAELPPGVSNAFAGMLGLSPAEFRAVADQRGFSTTDDGVLLDIQTKGLDHGHRDAFAIDGLMVRGFYPQYERVSAIGMRASAIRRVAELPFVRAVAPEYGATSGNSGSGSAY